MVSSGWLQRHGAIAVAVVALVLATVSVAPAARDLITGSEIKKGTIQYKHLSKKARAKLKGRRGPAGQQGAPGQQGAQGPAGPTFGTAKGADPLSSPSVILGTDSVTLPVAGKLLVIGQWSGGTIGCGTGPCVFEFGAYRGTEPSFEPVPASRQTLTLQTAGSASREWTVIGLIDAPAGQQDLSIGVRVVSGTSTSVSGGNSSIKTVLLGS